MTTSDSTALRRAGTIGAVGGALTALAGLWVQAVVQPASTVSDQMWSYPWSPSALGPVSLLYAVFHGLVLFGLFGFARSGLAGPGRGARVGTTFALTGSALLVVGELASIPFADQRVDAIGPELAGAIFGVATLLSAVGFLVTGITTLQARQWQGWRRFTPLATGIWLIVMIGLPATPVLAAGVGIYGLCLLVLGIALQTQPTPHRKSPSVHA
jgi:hypothetical protein